jgi:hypothetical protein
MASASSPKRNDVSPAVVVVLVVEVVVVAVPSPAGVGGDGVTLPPSPAGGGVGTGAQTLAASLQVWYRAVLVPVLTVESLGHLHSVDFIHTQDWSPALFYPSPPAPPSAAPAVLPSRMSDAQEPVFSSFPKSQSLSVFEHAIE